MSYKLGDKVICLDSANYLGITKGRTYTVHHIVTSFGQVGFILLKENIIAYPAELFAKQPLSKLEKIIYEL